MSQRTVTGAVAVVKINGIPVGKIRDIRATETYARGEVRGIGNLDAQEVPVLTHNGTFSIDAFLSDLNQSGIRQLLNREAISIQQFIDSITLNERGIDIYIYKRIPATIDQTTQLVTDTAEAPIAILRECYLDNVSFNVSEGQISTQSQTGRFLRPIIFNT